MSLSPEDIQFIQQMRQRQAQRQQPQQGQAPQQGQPQQGAQQRWRGRGYGWGRYGRPPQAQQPNYNALPGRSQPGMNPNMDYGPYRPSPYPAPSNTETYNPNDTMYTMDMVTLPNGQQVNRQQAAQMGYQNSRAQAMQQRYNQSRAQMGNWSGGSVGGGMTGGGSVGGQMGGQTGGQMELLGGRQKQYQGMMDQMQNREQEERKTLDSSAGGIGAGNSRRPKPKPRAASKPASKPTRKPTARKK